MQLRFPIYPKDSTLISASAAVGLDKQNTVWYFVSGAPVYSHDQGDLDSFRYITAQLYVMGHCEQKDIARVFQVSLSSIERSVKLYREEQARGFFKHDSRHGVPHKMVPKKLAEAQRMLDKGESNSAVARKLEVVESAIRYHLKKGSLKKKQN